MKYWCSMRINPNLMKLGTTVVSGNHVGFRHLRAAFQGQKYTPITIWPALRFQHNQINSLQYGQDSDLKQIENAFKDLEDGFWEKNSSEGIIGNSVLY